VTTDFPDSLEHELRALVGVERADVSWPPEDRTRYGRSRPWRCYVKITGLTDEECEGVTRRLREWHTDPCNELRDKLHLWFEPEGLADETMRRYGYDLSRTPGNGAKGYWVNRHTGSFRPRAEAEQVVSQWIKVDAWGNSTLPWMKENNDDQ